MSRSLDREQEYKFTPTNPSNGDQLLQVIHQNGQIGAFQALGTKDKIQTDTYLDDDENGDGLLVRGASLRTRFDGKNHVVTFKHDDRGDLSNRVQVEANVDRAELERIRKGNSQIEPVRMAQRLTGKGYYAPALRAVTHRLAVDYGVAEVALDRTSFNREGSIAPHMEIEVEKAGQTDLYRYLGATLSDLPTVRASTLSKYQRGRQLTAETQTNQIPRMDLTGGIQETIQTMEAMISGRPDQKHFVLRLAGGSASGKTQLVGNALSEYFGERARMVSADDYYKDSHSYRWDDPFAVDLSLAARNLRDWLHGRAAQKPIYGFSAGRTGYETVEPALVTIFEGIFVNHPMFNDFADFSVFVDAIGMHGMSMRRIMRDMVGGRIAESFRGQLGYLFNTVLPLHEVHVEPTRLNADLIIENPYNPGIEAQRMASKKIQFKYPAGNLTAEQLLELHAMQIGTSQQTDHYYRQEQMGPQERLRARYEGGSIVLTYEGPEAEDTIGIPRVDISVTPDEIAALEQQYDLEVEVHKPRRDIFTREGVLMTLDTVEGLGKYIELKVGSAEDIELLEKQVRDLGLDPSQRIRASYLDLKLGHK